MSDKTKIPSFEIRDAEWAQELQNGLEEYMATLYDAVMLEDEEEYDSPDNPADNTESGISFCGCNVCEGREILAYVTPRIIQGFLDGKVDIITV
jgi:hypothetical protein